MALSSNYIKKHLDKDAIFLDLQATSKEEIIEELVDRLYKLGRFSDKAAVLRAVREREAKMSTGMENGLALPHGKSDAVGELITAVGIKKAGLDFNSMDKSPARIFILTVSPSSQSGPHIRFLADIVRILNSAPLREKLLQASSVQDVLDLL